LKFEHQGSALNLARAREGGARSKIKNVSAPLFLLPPADGAERKRVWGRGNFHSVCIPPQGGIGVGSGSFFAISKEPKASKIFHSLIEKIAHAQTPKKERNFAGFGATPKAARAAGAGFLPRLRRGS